MRNHEVTKDDFLMFFPKARLCGQYGDGKNKAIDVVTDPVGKRVWYEFINSNQVVYTGPDLAEAIEYYNAA
ncbi:hypothetical protein Q9L42_021265 (plasmid) [Methylomarinum sp. Ch1-1]|uniref:Uncharacterized protein n=1 Tax=Methylomarinum roseum TaxID=3067653 RepID=A0AAU7P0R7_9GAMM|nr:hypothetical protein [Methylomarinum sp. Ch1-1]MDP4523192.1 hypothetical protein [Methylomarinum sp. Ch1-1]